MLLFGVIVVANQVGCDAGLVVMLVGLVFGVTVVGICGGFLGFLVIVVDAMCCWICVCCLIIGCA